MITSIIMKTEPSYIFQQEEHEVYLAKNTLL